MKVQLLHSFEEIISVENLLLAWREFIKGKRGRSDVQEFAVALMDNILHLHEDLWRLGYSHGPYQAFSINDPKPRNIHKASVRDRLLHHAIYRKLYPFFNNTFIADSYSCRDSKGTHAANERFRLFCNQVSNNNTHTCWVLKCDIKKFFASIDHAVLFGILRQYISDQKVLGLVAEVVASFHTTRPGTGLPLGNLTSQLLVNIYMNEFDQFAKHRLKCKYYIRYADDFVFLSRDRDQLDRVLSEIAPFLEQYLHLRLHPDKVFIKSLAAGVDFLGWVHFPDHRVLRTTSKRRMFKRIKEQETPDIINSYLGLLKHGNSSRLKALVAEKALLK